MNSSIIYVQHAVREEHHVFTCKEIPGLLVVSNDLRVAYDDVAPSVRLLLKLNMGLECEVTPVETFERFLSKYGQDLELPTPIGSKLPLTPSMEEEAAMPLQHIYESDQGYGYAISAVA